MFFFLTLLLLFPSASSATARLAQRMRATKGLTRQLIPNHPPRAPVRRPPTSVTRPTRRQFNQLLQARQAVQVPAGVGGPSVGLATRPLPRAPKLPAVLLRSGGGPSESCLQKSYFDVQKNLNFLRQMSFENVASNGNSKGFLYFSEESLALLRAEGGPAANLKKLEGMLVEKLMKTRPVARELRLIRKELKETSGKLLRSPNPALRQAGEDLRGVLRKQATEKAECLLAEDIKKVEELLEGVRKGIKSKLNLGSELENALAELEALSPSNVLKSKHKLQSDVSKFLKSMEKDAQKILDTPLKRPLPKIRLTSNMKRGAGFLGFLTVVGTVNELTFGTLHEKYTEGKLTSVRKAANKALGDERGNERALKRCEDLKAEIGTMGEELNNLGMIQAELQTAEQCGEAQLEAALEALSRLSTKCDQVEQMGEDALQNLQYNAHIEEVVGDMAADTFEAVRELPDALKMAVLKAQEQLLSMDFDQDSIPSSVLSDALSPILSPVSEEGAAVSWEREISKSQSSIAMFQRYGHRHLENLQEQTIALETKALQLEVKGNKLRRGNGLEQRRRELGDAMSGQVEHLQKAAEKLRNTRKMTWKRLVDERGSIDSELKALEGDHLDRKAEAARSLVEAVNKMGNEVEIFKEKHKTLLGSFPSPKDDNLDISSGYSTKLSGIKKKLNREVQQYERLLQSSNEQALQKSERRIRRLALSASFTVGSQMQSARDKANEEERLGVRVLEGVTRSHYKDLETGVNAS